MESSSLQFSQLAQTLSSRARSVGLDPPVFKSPPRIVGVTRTIRRRSDGRAVVAVAVRKRPRSAVVADMIDGVLVTNGLSGADRGRLGDELWQAFDDSLHVAA